MVWLRFLFPLLPSPLCFKEERMIPALRRDILGEGKAKQNCLKVEALQRGFARLDSRAKEAKYLVLFQSCPFNLSLSPFKDVFGPPWPNRISYPIAVCSVPRPLPSSYHRLAISTMRKIQFGSDMNRAFKKCINSRLSSAQSCFDLCQHVMLHVVCLLYSTRVRSRKGRKEMLFFSFLSST